MGPGRDPAPAGPASIPTAPYLKFADRPWVSYGELNARANRVANALLRPRGASGASRSRVMLPNCEEFLPVWYGILKAGAVMSSDQHGLQGRLPVAGPSTWSRPGTLVIADAYLDRLDLIKDELPLLEHVIVLRQGRQERPGARPAPARRGASRR